MIEVRTYPDKGPIGDRGCAYIAECAIAGAQHTARSHFGASFALARILVAAGVPDQPMRVRQDGLAGFMTWPSMHKAAGFTMREGRNTSLQRVRWEDPSLRLGELGVGGARKQGGNALGGTCEPLGPSRAVAGDRAPENAIAEIGGK